MERETALNYCKTCKTDFLTLADEKHDVCGNCLNDEYLKSQADEALTLSDSLNTVIDMLDDKKEHIKVSTELKILRKVSFRLYQKSEEV